MDETTGLLSAYAATLSDDELTEDAVHGIARCVVDAMACALAAYPMDAMRGKRERAAGRASGLALAGLRAAALPEHEVGADRDRHELDRGPGADRDEEAGVGAVFHESVLAGRSGPFVCFARYHGECALSARPGFASALRAVAGPSVAHGPFDHHTPSWPGVETGQIANMSLRQEFVTFKGRELRIAQAFSGHPVAFRPTAIDGVWSV